VVAVVVGITITLLEVVVLLLVVQLTRPEVLVAATLAIQVVEQVAELTVAMALEGVLLAVLALMQLISKACLQHCPVQVSR
jgi:hypothetical protein